MIPRHTKKTPIFFPKNFKEESNRAEDPNEWYEKWTYPFLNFCKIWKGIGNREDPLSRERHKTNKKTEGGITWKETKSSRKMYELELSP